RRKGIPARRGVWLWTADEGEFSALHRDSITLRHLENAPARAVGRLCHRRLDRRALVSRQLASGLPNGDERRLLLHCEGLWQRWRFLRGGHLAILRQSGEHGSAALFHRTPNSRPRVFSYSATRCPARTAAVRIMGWSDSPLDLRALS